MIVLLICAIVSSFYAVRAYNVHKTVVPLIAHAITINDLYGLLALDELSAIFNPIHYGRWTKASWCVWMIVEKDKLLEEKRAMIEEAIGKAKEDW